MRQGFGWLAIARLGAVQAAIGAVTMLATSLLNRLMVLEYGLAAGVPAGLVAWHYAVQFSRAAWGHGSDRGRRRTPWIIGGMAVLGLGALLAVHGVTRLDAARLAALGELALGFTLIGAGVGAAGTSVLAMLASGVAPERRAAAAATTWIMMIFGIVVAAGTAGALLDPYSAQRLLAVAGGVVAAAFTVTLLATFRLERGLPRSGAAPVEAGPTPTLREALAEIFADPEASRFTLFIFVSMLAYAMQDLILEPFTGLVFGMTPGQSTSLSGLQNGGVLIGMIATGLGGSAFRGRLPVELRTWTMLGCLGSALALAGLALAAQAGPGWPLALNIGLLGLCNGAFAVSAIGSMMGLAGAGQRTGEGVRMGVWGTAQALAFGLGGLVGAVGVDLARTALGHPAGAFALIFLIEAGLFLAAAMLALRTRAAPRLSPSLRSAGT
ncbi:BCD family MFS transporter [Novosphingobium piscinae]|uniref:BCD family MFS transporter n=1 Tax=Novosphingobium piscinae TaxID=1507448 RepID=A0A7X1KPB9_9SPHN|nr:BCD family MFS transporter [Novosphingobium piscinae]MBC2668517.1 BCD family MFS transporter [Novosphingobium piscinae]